jgi:UDP-glucose 4-epimerase
MHALVTGGAGFIGSVLVDRLLAEGHRVDVIDNLSSGSLGNLAEARRVAGGSFNFHQQDIRSPEVAELIALRKPEVIWHLVATPHEGTGVAVAADVNVVGTLKVLEAARQAGCRKVVVASSGAAVYAEPAPAQLPMAENHPRQPRGPHGIAKHAVDAYLIALREPFGLEFTSLVLGTVYGPRDRHGVVGTWARAITAGQPCPMLGDGGQTRDFVFVDDVVDGLARAATRGDGLLLNLGTGLETSLTVLHGMLLDALGAPASGIERRPPRPGEVHRCALDSARAGIYLDWRPWTDLSQGLATVAASFPASRVTDGLPE